MHRTGAHAWAEYMKEKRVSDTSAGQARYGPALPVEDWLDALDELSMPVKVHPRPNEVEVAMPFAEDTLHASYDPRAVHRFWRVLSQVTRFSGRKALEQTFVP